jgi:hypothetical protein
LRSPSLGRVIRRPVHAACYRLSHASRVLLEGREAHRPAALVHPTGVFNRMGAHLASVVPVVLRAVDLFLALKDTNPVFEHGDLGRLDVAARCSCTKQLEPTPLKGRHADGMLQNEPGRG